MVEVWFMDDEEGDLKTPHHKNPPEYLSLDKLKETSGVEYFKINLETYEDERSYYQKLKKERLYDYQDIIELSRSVTPNFDEQNRRFAIEHLHTDEEVRFVLAGSGYFDVRDHSDRWVRVHVMAGDFIVLPAGIYHRFTVDEKEYIKVIRLYCGVPVWTAYDRPDADELPCRISYIQSSQMRSLGK